MEIISIALIILGIILIYRSIAKKSSKYKAITIKQEWKSILQKHVLFYKKLSHQQKLIFEQRIIFFLNDCIITGVGTKVEDLDKILIASSAIIPIFSFPHWQYPHLTEIVLYPNSFNGNFETTGNERNILGMVGNGFMEGKMILSKNALRTGFQNETDKKKIQPYMNLYNLSIKQMVLPMASPKFFYKNNIYCLGWT